MQEGALFTPRRSSRVAARAEQEHDREQGANGTVEGAAEPDGQDAAVVVEAPAASQPEATEGQAGEEEPELDAFDEDARAAVDAFEAAAADPAAFLRPSAEVSGLARQAAKVLYDLAAASMGPSGQSGAGAALPELYTEGFDAEQIWLQLDLQAGGALKRARKLMRRAGEVPSLVLPEMEEALDDLLREGDGSEGTSGSDEEGSGQEELALPSTREPGEPEEMDGEGGDTDAEPEEDLDEQPGGSDANEDDGGVNNARRQRRGGAAGKLRPAEDRFLRFADMDRFVEEGERAAMADEDDDEDDEDEEEEEEDDDSAPGGTGRRQQRASRDPEADDDEEEDQLEALLDDARKLGGSRASPGKRVQFADLEEEDADEAGTDEEEEGGDEGRAEDAKYGDFFGPGGEAEDEDEDGGEETGASDLEDGNGGLGPEDNDVEDEDDDEDEDMEGRLGGPAPAGVGGAGGAPDQAPAKQLSSHERRVARMAERARALEAQNMGDKQWFLRGEANAGARPVNSALEVDLDFERVVRPPPAPTEDTTRSLEDLIRRRVAERAWDDVPRMAPPPPEVHKRTLELDDKRSGKGLGEIYEEEYVAAATAGAATLDRDEKVRAEARALAKLLFAKLDALSHFHYVPKPVLEELSVRADVPALAMEEVAPQVVSEAAMRRPEEVFRAEAHGAPAAEAELTREQRRSRRARKKRAHAGRATQQAEEKAARPATQGGGAALPGLKSAAAEEAAAAAAKAAKKKARKGGGAAAAPPAERKRRGAFSSSSAYFGMLQDEREAAAAGGSGRPAKKQRGGGGGPGAGSSKSLKL